MPSLSGVSAISHLRDNGQLWLVGIFNWTVNNVMSATHVKESRGDQEQLFSVRNAVFPGFSDKGSQQFSHFYEENDKQTNHHVRHKFTRLSEIGYKLVDSSVHPRRISTEETLNRCKLASAKYKSDRKIRDVS